MKKNTSVYDFISILVIFSIFMVYICFSNDFYLQMCDSAKIVVPIYKEYIIIFFIILLIISFLSIHGKHKHRVRISIISFMCCFFMMFLLGSTFYSIEKDSIVKYTLFAFQLKKYEYLNINDAQLYLGASGTRNGGLSLTYTLNMDDGEKIEIILNQSYFENYDDVVSFDKKISEKRSVVSSDNARISIENTDKMIPKDAIVYFNNILGTHGDGGT